MKFDRYHHTILDALLDLAASPAYEPTLTWDGKNNYAVQPSAKYAPLDDGHRPILTLDDLYEYCDGDLSESAVQACVPWVEENQVEWFEEAAPEQVA